MSELNWRPCWQCGSTKKCGHREPKVELAEAEALMRIPLNLTVSQMRALVLAIAKEKA